MCEERKLTHFTRGKFPEQLVIEMIEELTFNSFAKYTLSIHFPVWFILKWSNRTPATQYSYEVIYCFLV